MEALVGFLPIALIVLACPLMMIFMHRRHGGGGHAVHGDHDDAGADTSNRIAELERELSEMKRQLTPTPKYQAGGSSANGHMVEGPSEVQSIPKE